MHPTPRTTKNRWIFDADGDVVYSDETYYPWADWDEEEAQDICNAVNAWRAKKETKTEEEA